MTPELSRRTVLQGLGAVAVTAFAPAPVLAALPRRLRSLEEIVGPRLMAFAQCEDTPQWLWDRDCGLFDVHDRFRIGPAFREVLTVIMNGYEAAVGPPAATFAEHVSNRIVLAALSHFDLLPPRLGFGHFGLYPEEEPERESLSVGDSWERMDWPDPTGIAQEKWPPLPADLDEALVARLLRYSRYYRPPPSPAHLPESEKGGVSKSGRIGSE